MKYINNINYWFQLHDRTILIICISILSLLSLSTQYEVCNLYYHQSGLDCLNLLKQISSILVGLIVFLALQCNHEKKIKNLNLQSLLLSGLILTSILIIIVDMTYEYSFSLLLFKQDAGIGLWILFALIIFIAAIFDYEQKGFQYNKYAIITYLTLSGMIITFFADTLMLFLFIIFSAASLWILEKKSLSIYIMYLGVFFFTFLSLAETFSLDKPFEGYSDLHGDAVHFKPYPSTLYFIRGMISGSNYPHINGRTLHRSCLPDACSEYIFSIFGLKFGLIGVFLLIICLLTIIYFGLKASKCAPSKSSAFIVFSLTVLFALFSFLGMASPTGLIFASGEGIPVFSLSPSKTIFAFLTFGFIYKNLRLKKVAGEDINSGFSSFTIPAVFWIISFAYSLIIIRILYLIFKWGCYSKFWWIDILLNE